MKDFILYPSILPITNYFKFPHLANYADPFFEVAQQGTEIFMGVKGGRPMIKGSSSLYLDPNGAIYLYSSGGGASGTYVKIEASSSRWIASSGYFMFQDYLRGEWDNTHDLGTSTYEWRDLFIDGKAFIDNATLDIAHIGGGYGDTGTTLYANGDVSMNGNLIIDGTCLSEGADCSADIAELTQSKASADNTTCITTPEHNETVTHNYYNYTNEECEYQLIEDFYYYVCVNVTETYEFQNISDICSDNYKEFEEGKFNKTIVCVNETSTWTEEEIITIPRKTECSLNPNFNLEFESGDVVCIDETDPSHIKFCDKQYNTLVVGVINYDATMIINQRAPYPLSLTGNVPIKVVCSTPIEIGDLLVSSNTKGYAQSYKTWIPTKPTNLDEAWNILKKVWENQGSPFAKSLESCDSGNKTIRAWI